MCDGDLWSVICDVTVAKTLESLKFQMIVFSSNDVFFN